MSTSQDTAVSPPGVVELEAQITQLVEAFEEKHALHVVALSLLRLQGERGTRVYTLPAEPGQESEGPWWQVFRRRLW